MSVDFTDDFNRANAANLGANYTSLGNPFTIVSNQAAAPASNGADYVNSTTPGAACWARVNAAVNVAAANYLGLGVRLAPGSVNGYYTAWDTGGLSIYRIDGGTPTALGATGLTPPSNGQDVYIEMRGSTLRVFYGPLTGPTLVGSRTDTTYSAAGNVLLLGQSTTARLEDLSFGTLPTLSSPTPTSGISTPTTASVGATTDQAAGTLYVVVDTASLTGITEAQILLGQNASGVAAVASGNVSISTTTPTVSITGLTDDVTYNYAVLQLNGGYSNIATGSFTTAALASASDSVTFSDSAASARPRFARSVMELGGGPLGAGTFGAFVKAPAASGGLAAVAADTVAFSDSAVGVTERVATASDTLSPSDSAVSVTERVAAATDAATFSDSAVGITERVAAASDTFSPSDSAISSVGFAAAASDTFSPSDSAVSTTERVATASDTFSPSDSAAGTSDRVAVAADTLIPSDSAVSVTERVAVAADSVSFTDASEGFVAVPAEATDTFSPSDSAVSVSDRVAAATDTFSPSDSAVSVTDRVAAAADTFSPSDSASSATERLAEASDSISLTDSGVGSVVAGAVATGEDTFSPSDSAVGVTERVAAAVDAIALTDSALADRIDVAVAVDSVSFSDAAEGFVPRDAEASDSVSFSDSGTAVVVPPTPATGGGRAWLRAWLQQQYTKDFEEYERRRSERKAPVSTPALAKRSPAAPAVETKTPAPRATQSAVEIKELSVLVAQFSAAIKSPPPFQLELPALPSLDGVKAAAAKRPAPEFTAEDEELVLQIARTLNL